MPIAFHHIDSDVGAVLRLSGLELKLSIQALYSGSICIRVSFTEIRLSFVHALKIIAVVFSL